MDDECSRLIVLVWCSFVCMWGPYVQVSAAQNPADRHGTISGEVRDAETNEPIAHVQVLLEEIGRFGSSKSNGRFWVREMPPGEYTLKTFRIGYRSEERPISLAPGDTLQLLLYLSDSPITAGELSVRGARDTAGAGTPDVVVEARRLRQNLGVTIAATLDDEPGISMRSMGPAPARPVLRGLGGERLMVLEDGERTGDLSHSSSDHAVAIDPFAAERIEVIRGPSVLIYGSNALGGVVNVERGFVPRDSPDDVAMEYGTHIESVNRGVAAGGSIRAPIGLFAVRASGSLRRTGDLRTPAGILDNTALSSHNALLGTSLVGSKGYAGVAGSFYRSGYGIPGGFVGTHPGGVTIEMERYQLEGRSSYRVGSAVIRRLEAHVRSNWYHHEEFEANGLLGIEFGVLTTNGRLIARTDGWGPFTRGAIGIWGEHRNYATGGLNFTPNSLERTLAGFLVQTARLGNVTLEGGLRIDYRHVIPEREDPSRQIGSVSAPIRRRAFTGLSASVSATWPLGLHLSTGLRGMRSLRMPGIEELYSGGPHLASYSFEIGNTHLAQEYGWGGEWFMRRTGGAVEGRLSLYYNHIAHYIFPRNTGAPSRVQLPIYRFDGAAARLFGGESSGDWHLSDRLALRGSVSYVRGTLVDARIPLPEMPPLSGKLGVAGTAGDLRFTVTMRWAASQHRVFRFEPPIFGEGGQPVVAEPPTAGYIVWDAGLQYHLSTGSFLHTFDLGVENITNAEYRDHLSRVRVIMPEAGRNVKLQYRIYF